MRKILITVVLALALLSTSVYAFDVGGITIGTKRVKVFESINASGTQIVRSVPTGLIGPGNRIVGLVVTAAAAGGTGNVGIYDSVVSGVPAEVIAEAEVVDGGNGVLWFPFSLTVVTSIEIRQGENTVTYIYYE